MRCVFVWLCLGNEWWRRVIIKMLSYFMCDKKFALLVKLGLDFIWIIFFFVVEMIGEFVEENTCGFGKN